MHFKKRKREKVGYIRVKVDIQKAYDMVDWNALMDILKALGFFERFINLVHHCLSTISF